MKKIIFACCAMCFLTGVAFGDTKCGVECNDTNKGKHLLCPGSKAEYYRCGDKNIWGVGVIMWCTGKVQPSNYINEGVDVLDDNNLLVWVKKGSAKTGKVYLFDTNSQANVCSGCRQGYEFDDDADKCVRTDKTSVPQTCNPNDPTCNQNSRIEQLSTPCPGGKNINDACEAGGHATKGRCRDLEATNGGSVQRTCAATECKDGYLLWLNKNGNSMGICHTEKYAKDFCSKGCGNCNPNEECVPWIVDTPNNLKINGQTLVPKKNGAYRECHCVEKTNGNGGNAGGGDGSPDTEECEECVYRLKVDLRCANGKTFYKDTQIKITKAEAEILKWKEAKDKLESATPGALIDDLLKEINGYEELINKICDTGNNGGGMGVVINNSAEINAAKNKISSFFNTAESTASVWKDAEGKFNTARLASDLTAGVVLGTVGGVVSGVVIKKKQVEKGFEALHCTVGGQPIADWGDTFNVGLR